MSTPSTNYGPSGIVWSLSGVATSAEIVAHFNSLDYREVTVHNWGTCDRDCAASWDVTDETYINGVMLTLDFDFYMGYLIQAVDRTTGQCTYIALATFHGHDANGRIAHDFITWPGTHTFFGKEDGFSEEAVTQWAVQRIYGMIEDYKESQRPPAK